MKPSAWWRGSLWLLGFGCLWLNVCDDPPLHTGACLREVTSTGATVATIAAADCSAQLRLFGPDGALLQEVAQPSPRRRHALRVEGLRPGTEYRYELRLDGEPFEAGRIRTAPEGDNAAVRFALCGDSGDQPWWVWLQRTPLWHWPARWGLFADSAAVTQVGAAIAAWQPDFLLHLGDIVYPKGLHAHYMSGFFRPFAEVLRNAPVYAALGNHDVMDCGGLQALANLGGPVGELTGDARCYSFARGPVRIVVLDANSFGLRDPELPQHPVFGLLEQELVSATEPWLVLAMHFPIRSASRQRDRPDLLKWVLPLAERWGVGLVLSGHDHCYQRFGRPEAGEVVLVVSGGGGKDLYSVHPDKKAVVLRSAFHWCTVEREEAVLKFRSHGLEEPLIDSFEVPLPQQAARAWLAREGAARLRRIEALEKR